MHVSLISRWGLFIIHNGHSTQSSHTKPTSHHTALLKIYYSVLVILVNISPKLWSQNTGKKFTDRPVVSRAFTEKEKEIKMSAWTAWWRQLYVF